MVIIIKSATKLAKNTSILLCKLVAGAVATMCTNDAGIPKGQPRSVVVHARVSPAVIRHAVVALANVELGGAMLFTQWARRRKKEQLPVLSCSVGKAGARHHLHTATAMAATKFQIIM